MRDKISEHLTANYLLSSCQHGFVPGMSYTTNLLATLEKWTLMMDERLAVDAIYLDFVKAFDVVPHARLLRKVELLGVAGKALDWIRDLFTCRRQRISVNGVLSEWSAVKSGVPQGSILGPVLFVVFINDLPKAVNSLCSMYADDTKVSGPAVSGEDGDRIQKDLR